MAVGTKCWEKIRQWVGAPGWVSQLRVQLLISAQFVILGWWDRAPHLAPQSVRSLSLSLCCSCSLSPSKVNKLNLFKKIKEGNGNVCTPCKLTPLASLGSSHQNGSWNPATSRIPLLPACVQHVWRASRHVEAKDCFLLLRLGTLESWKASGHYQITLVISTF